VFAGDRAVGLVDVSFFGSPLLGWADSCIGRMRSGDQEGRITRRLEDRGD
jgi:hypothetical protein